MILISSASSQVVELCGEEICCQECCAVAQLAFTPDFTAPDCRQGCELFFCIDRPIGSQLDSGVTGLDFRQERTSDFRETFVCCMSNGEIGVRQRFLQQTVKKQLETTSRKY